jgi:hypothetical protein
VQHVAQVRAIGERRALEDVGDLVCTDLGGVPFGIVRQEDRVGLARIDRAVERDAGRSSK